VPIRVLHVGLGPIGVAILKLVSAHPNTTVAGVVDTDPAKVDRDVGEAAGIRHRFGIKVSSDLAAAIKASKPDVAVVSTSSSLRQVMATLEGLVRAAVPVVSTTEELVYPTKANAALAKKLDAKAKRARVAILGTGVNPGFVMDALPIALSGVSAAVTSVEVDRVQDARIRRVPFQKKIGAGMSVAEFAAAVKSGSVRHVGLAESVSMIADAMGWRLDRITDEIHPKVADTPVEGAAIVVQQGQVAGLVQDGIGFRKGRPLVRLHMEAYLGAPETYDAVRLNGTPPLSVRFEGGIHGDVATAAIAFNSIPRVIAAAPGLRTMRDMVLPSIFPLTR
jgi:hypothetical protein